MTSELQQKMNGDGTIDQSQFLDFLAFRRSVRRFTTQSVRGSMVEKLIHAAGYIPSGGNSHSYQFTVVTKGETRDRLEHELRRIYTFMRRVLKNTFLKNLFALLSNRQTRAFLHDAIYLKRVSYLLDQYERGEDPVFYHAPLIIFVHSDTLIPTPKEDCILAAYNIVLMGQTMGLGSCFVSLAQNAINTSRTCRKILNMSPTDRVHAVVVLGYPAVQFHQAVPRESKAIKWINT
jgi:nitroreductase